MCNSKNNPKHTKKKKLHTFFSLWGSSVLEEVVQRSCEVSVFGDTQNPAWQGSEWWSWTRWSAEVSPQRLRVSSPWEKLQTVGNSCIPNFRSCPWDTQHQIWQHCGWLWEQPSFGSDNCSHFELLFQGSHMSPPCHSRQTHMWGLKELFCDISMCRSKYSSQTLSSGHEKLNGQLSLSGKKKPKNQLIVLILC